MTHPRSCSPVRLSGADLVAAIVKWDLPHRGPGRSRICKGRQGQGQTGKIRGSYKKREKTLLVGDAGLIAAASGPKVAPTASSREPDEAGSLQSTEEARARAAKTGAERAGWCRAGDACTGKLDKSCSFRHREVKEGGRQGKCLHGRQKNRCQPYDHRYC